MMNFINNLPKSVKIAIPFILLGLLTAGILTFEDINTISNPEISGEEQQDINIGFVIRDGNNNPLENVSISFQGKEFVTERVTNSDGYVKLSLPDQEDVEIVMIKEGYGTKRVNFNTNIDRGKTITYYLNRLKDDPVENQVSIDKIVQNNCMETTTIDYFKFSLQKCEQSGSTLILYLDIKNLGRRRNITLYTNQSRIINSGNSFSAVATYIGQPSWRKYSQEKIPNNTSIKAAFKFDDIIIDRNETLFIELNTSISRLEFKNESISSM